MLNLMVRLDCSRCKKKVPVSFRDASTDTEQVAQLSHMIFVWTCDDQSHPPTGSMILCPQCHQELKEWMRGKSENIVFETEASVEETDGRKYPHVDHTELKKLEASNPPANPSANPPTETTSDED